MTTREKSLVRLLKINAYNLWVASLCAGPQSIRDLFEELRSPKVGDLVLETSTYWRHHNPEEGIGELVSVTQEPLYSLEDWKSMGGAENEPIPTQSVYTIALNFDDYRHFRWTNASFIKVKTSDRV